MSRARARRPPRDRLERARAGRSAIATGRGRERAIGREGRKPSTPRRRLFRRDLSRRPMRRGPTRLRRVFHTKMCRTTVRTVTRDITLNYTRQPPLDKYPRESLETRERRNLSARARDHPRRQTRFSLPFFVGRACLKKKVKNPTWQTISLHILFNKIISRGKKKEKKGKGARDFNIQRASIARARDPSRLAARIFPETMHPSRRANFSFPFSPSPPPARLPPPRITANFFTHTRTRRRV